MTEKALLMSGAFGRIDGQNTASQSLQNNLPQDMTQDHRLTATCDEEEATSHRPCGG